MPLPCRGWTLSRMKTQSAIRDAPGSSRTLGMGNFQLDAPQYGPFRFSWICLPRLVSSFFSRGGGMHLFFIKKKSFPQQLRAMTHSINSHTRAAVWTWGGGLTTFSGRVSRPPSRGDVSLQTKVSQRCVCLFHLQGPKPESSSF